MKHKTLFAIGIIMITLIVIGVFVSAEISGNSGNTGSGNFEEHLEEIAGAEVSDAIKEYIESFAEKMGINAEDITGVTPVDFGNLPKEVNIDTVNDNNLEIYQVDYTENSEDKKIFMIAYSVEKLEAQGDLIIAEDKREFLSFGFSGNMKESAFLKTDTDVETSMKKGYVMMRRGSITAISTNLEIVSNEGQGKIEIVIYRNGEPIGFGNSFSINSAGVKKDYDVQSNGIVTFESGDVISAYARADRDAEWKDVITLVEITAEN